MEQKAVAMTSTGKMQITNIEEAYRQASLYSKSGLVPKSFDTPEKVLVGIQYALELNLPPLTALKNMYVVKGIPALFGDLPLSMVMKSSAFEYIKEIQFDKNNLEIKSDNQNLGAECEFAVCKIKRKGQDEVERAYSWTEAQAAGLHRDNYGDKATWKNFRRRMLQMRARSWALKDMFPDVLLGCAIKEYDHLEEERTVNPQVENFDVVIPVQLVDPVDMTSDDIPEEIPELDMSQNIAEATINEPLVLATNEKNTEELQSCDESIQMNDESIPKPDEQGFVTDPEKPFIKTKSKPSLNEMMKERAGDAIVTVWKKYENSMVKEIPQDDILEMLSKIEVGALSKPVPTLWREFYEIACVYLNRKKEME